MIESKKIVEVGKSTFKLSISKVRLASSTDILTRRYLGLLAGGWILCSDASVELVIVVVQVVNLRVWNWK